MYNLELCHRHTHNNDNSIPLLELSQNKFGKWCSIFTINYLQLIPVIQMLLTFCPIARMMSKIYTIGPTVETFEISIG